MFPGDAETQNDCVQVDHKGDVTVHFRAEVRPGYEKLAEVLKLRVSVGGSVLYDGLMAEMPAAVDTPLPAGSDTLDYQLTAYLDTSVGNPYMYQQLVADFYWWVADSEELAPPTRRHHAAPALGSGGAGVRCGTDGAAASPQGGVP